MSSNKSKKKLAISMMILLVVVSFLAVSVPSLTSEAAGQKEFILNPEAVEKNLMINAENNPQLQNLANGKECEACGMNLSLDDQWHFRIKDGDGQVHYVECFMCALNLVKRYEVLHIETFCDWYGPNYTITIDSEDKGDEITINPPSAMFLRTGFCENNRVAYNQTAAEALTTNYSQYTSIFQQHPWTVTPSRTTVLESIAMCNDMLTRNLRPTLSPIIAAPLIAVLIDVGASILLRIRQKRVGQRFLFAY